MGVESTNLSWVFSIKINPTKVAALNLFSLMAIEKWKMMNGK